MECQAICQLAVIKQIYSLLLCRWFKDYSELDYARSGNEATSDITIDAGTKKNCGKL